MDRAGHADAVHEGVQRQAANRCPARDWRSCAPFLLGQMRFMPVGMSMIVTMMFMVVTMFVFIVILMIVSAHAYFVAVRSDESCLDTKKSHHAERHPPTKKPPLKARGLRA